MAGCSTCPLDKVPGIQKIQGFQRIRGKQVMVWGLAPAGRENEQGLELVGPAGQFWWKELLRCSGLRRRDCDVHNVVCCWPRFRTETGYATRDPTVPELKSCAVHSWKAFQLNQQKGGAKLHIILGAVAAKALLPDKERRSIDSTGFLDSKLLAGRVLVVDHPAHFVRGSTQQRLDRWRQRLRLVPSLLSGDPRKVELIDHVLLRQESEVEKVFDHFLEQKRVVVFDIEHGVVNNERKILCISFCNHNRRVYTVPVDHPGFVWEDREGVVQVLRNFFASDVPKGAHYGVSDSEGLSRYLGVTEVNEFYLDSLFAEYLRDSDQTSYALNSIGAARWPEYGDWKPDIKKYFIFGVNYADVPLESLARYCAADSLISRKVLRAAMQSGISVPLLKVYHSASYTVHDMEGRGPSFDFKYYQRLKVYLPKELLRLQNNCQELAQDTRFNPSSPKQVAEILFDRLRLPVPSSGRTTEEEALKVLGRLHPLPKAVLEFRKIDHLSSTIQSYYQCAKRHGGQLRTRWWMTGTAAMRFSSGGKGAQGFVNLQNLARDALLKALLVSDTEWQRALNKSHNPALGVFLERDFSQIELRILAILCRDERLIAAFREGLDIHKATASEIFDIPYEEVTEEQRQDAKVVNFAIVYGLRAAGLAARLGKTVGEAEDFMDSYFSRYSGVLRFIEGQHEFVKRKKYVDNLFGFRRYLEKEGRRGTSYLNAAVNTPIQSTAHGLLLVAFALLRERAEEYNHLSDLVMEVHDSLLWRCPLSRLAQTNQQARDLLDRAVLEYCHEHFGIDFSVPIFSEGKAGFRLVSLIKIDKGKGTASSSFLDSWRKTDRGVQKGIDSRIV